MAIYLMHFQQDILIKNKNSFEQDDDDEVFFFFNLRDSDKYQPTPPCENKRVEIFSLK